MSYFILAGILTGVPALAIMLPLILYKQNILTGVQINKWFEALASGGLSLIRKQEG